MVEQPENREPEVPTEAPDADLRAAIDGLGAAGPEVEEHVGHEGHGHH